MNSVFSDSFLFALAFFVLAQTGVTALRYKDAARKKLTVALLLFSIAVAVALAVTEFLTGVSTRDRLIGSVVCTMFPNTQRCLEIEDSRPKHTEQEVTQLAITKLIGDPYGRTREQVRSNILRVRFTPSGLCGSGYNWVVSVRVPPGFAGNIDAIEGDLMFDDKTGDWACWGLPYLY